MEENQQNSHFEYSGQDQRKAILNQEARFYELLKGEPATASMASAQINVPQKCLTWYKRNFEAIGILWVVKRDRCKITNRFAQYLTTDPAKAPDRPIQLSLFGAMNGEDQSFMSKENDGNGAISSPFQSIVGNMPFRSASLKGNGTSGNQLTC